MGFPFSNALVEKDIFWRTYNPNKIEYTDCTSAKCNECPVYDTKQSDGEVQTMLEL